MRLNIVEFKIIKYFRGATRDLTVLNFNNIKSHTETFHSSKFSLRYFQNENVSFFRAHRTSNKMIVMFFNIRAFYVDKL